MMGIADPQPALFSHINVEQCVTADHPMRKIRPLIDTARLRQLCAPLYAEGGRPSIPDSVAGSGAGSGPRPSHGHVSGRAAVEPTACLDDRSGCEAGEQGNRDGGQGGGIR